jgi:exosortase D (VPLPA-CTERM-specific)
MMDAMIPAEKNNFNNYWVKAFILTALFIFAYWIPLRGTVNVWMHEEDYSYGFFIPLISAYILWEKRESLKDVHVRNSWGVFPMLAVFVLLSIYAILGSSGNISRPAIPILIFLFVVFCFGADVAWRLILPIGFLIFMVPVPAFLERTLGLFLKGISSSLGGGIIRLFNIPVHVSGNVIDLGVNKLQVVDACSGLRYLFPLMAIGVLYAHFFEKERWKKWVCFLATIPLSILTNGLRIGVTGILTNSYGVKVAEGFMHGFSGWVFFLVSFFVLFLFGRILSVFPARMPNNVKKNFPGTGMYFSSHGIPENIDKGFIVCVVLLLMVGGVSLSTKVLPPVKIKGGIGSFPSSFAGWEGRQEFVDPEIVAKSGAEESFDGLYTRKNGEVVSLYMGYRSTAFLENENFFHSPTVCLPSSGWEVGKVGSHDIGYVPVFGNLTVTQMVMNNMGSRQLVNFWFQTKDRATPHKDVNRLHLALHAIRRDNTHDLFIRLITPIGSGEKMEDAQARMDRFARELQGALVRFLKERQFKG